MVSNLEVAWAAGLLEGEGCFTSHTSAPYILLDMTDKDVIEKLHSVFPSGNIRGPYTHKTKPHNKPRWRFDAFGRKAKEIMEIVRPFMGQRRGAKIDELLENYVWVGGNGKGGSCGS